MPSKSDLIRKGKKKYEDKVGRIGADTYYSCGEKGGMNVAVCLKAAKQKQTVSDWSDSWETAMSI